MVTPSVNSLDSQELLHLALLDSRKGQHDDAIQKLKTCLQIDPGNIKAQFLMGAEHAEIGLYDRAIEEMRRTIELDKSMGIAHFQLGLIYFSQNKYREAGQYWAPLHSLPGSKYLAEFSLGLLKFSEGQLNESFRHLSEGMKSNNVNSALNVDMGRILAEIEGLLKKGQSTPNQSTPQTVQHVFLGSYSDQSEDSAL